MRGTLLTPVGEFVIDTRDRGLLACGTWIERDDAGDDSSAARAHLEAARTALGEYFDGRRLDFGDLELAPEGTAFQLAVWRALRGLPYGRTVSYRQLAESLGSARAVRAVGQANGRNPIGIVQPCHRVIGSDGRLVGFAGGLPMKRWLLEHEARVESRSQGAHRSSAAD